MPLPIGLLGAVAIAGAGAYGIKKWSESSEHNAMIFDDIRATAEALEKPVLLATAVGGLYYLSKQRKG